MANNTAGNTVVALCGDNRARILRWRFAIEIAIPDIGIQPSTNPTQLSPVPGLMDSELVVARAYRPRRLEFISPWSRERLDHRAKARRKLDLS